MIYTYKDIEKIKKDMEWVIKENRTNPKLRTNPEFLVFARGLENELYAYDNLLQDVGRNGVIDSVKDDCGFLDVTSDLIRKVKKSISSIG